MSNTPKHRQSWILQELKANPTLSYVEVRGEYKQKWGKGNTTFDKDWKKAQAEFNSYQKQAEKIKLDTYLEVEKQAVKNGLKTKYERLLILQGRVDDILERLRKGTHPKTDTEQGDTLSERLLTPQEIVAYNRSLKELQGEISKIEGDYAPSQTQVEGAFGFQGVKIVFDDGKE